MNDKYAKEIAKELRLIRIELQKTNNPIPNEDEIDDFPDIDPAKLNEIPAAGDRVIIK